MSSSSEAPLQSDSSHVPVDDDLPYIHPTDPRKASTGPLTDLPLFREMEDLRRKLNLKDNPEELDAIMAGTLLDVSDEGLTEEEKKIIRNNIRDLRKMSMNDMLEYVALCTFN